MALFARANANTLLLTNNCYLLKLTSNDVIFRGFGSYTKNLSIPRKASKCACLVHSFSRCNVTSNTPNYLVRKCHVVPHNVNYQPFAVLVARRREEANRSIVVQVQSANSYEELIAYCKQFGDVNEMHHYTIKDKSHFYLIEFNEEASAKAVLESATHLNLDAVIPVQSQMLWFRNVRSSASIKASDKSNGGNLNTQPKAINGSQFPDNTKITEKLKVTDSISEQMILFHNAWKLDEVGIRLRFLTAHQLERSFVGLFPHITVSPFGSSVNGFGKRDCDLDLVLALDQDQEKTSSRFVFHTKSISSDSKLQTRRLMETIADSIQYFVPGVSNVRRILHARVPIIKYDQSLMGLECDLSMTNMVAFYMSELLCLYGEVDWRVRPLVFTIRHWAKSVGLTNMSPGRWISNFSITLLVLFYLQHRRILPSLNTLKSFAGKADKRVADCIDCTFLRDVTKMPLPVTNTESLEILLQGFFEYYSTFDFSTKGISLLDGMSVFKPDFSPLYICNPLETNLNVSKNVSAEEIERLKLALRNASWLLECHEDEKKGVHGILSIFEQKLDVVSFVGGKRVVNMSAIFRIPNERPTKSLKTVANGINEVVSESEANRNVRMKKGRAKRR